jgi:hypothetical protein
LWIDSVYPDVITTYCYQSSFILRGQNRWEQDLTSVLFRFILDNKLATMYSSGSPEGGSDSSENRGEFLEKLQVMVPVFRKLVSQNKMAETRIH